MTEDTSLILKSAREFWRNTERLKPLIDTILSLDCPLHQASVDEALSILEQALKDVNALGLQVYSEAIYEAKLKEDRDDA